jgi:ribosomal protein S18 acetylase RimI-like enzyme
MLRFFANKALSRSPYRDWSATFLAQKPQIRYIHGDQTLLDQTEPLWMFLNQYHCHCSTHFKDHYNGMTFEKRKVALYKKASLGELRVDLALDDTTGEAVGYVVSSVIDKVGEVDSVFVKEICRGRGIGGMLMGQVLAWMTQRGAETKIVDVSVGNEGAFGFYGRFGFLPRKTVLQQQS